MATSQLFAYDAEPSVTGQATVLPQSQVGWSNPSTVTGKMTSFFESLTRISVSSSMSVVHASNTLQRLMVSTTAPCETTATTPHVTA